MTKMLLAIYIQKHEKKKNEKVRFSYTLYFREYSKFSHQKININSISHRSNYRAAYRLGFAAQSHG
jgi:hypothetical protein